MAKQVYGRSFQKERQDDTITVIDLTTYHDLYLELHKLSICYIQNFHVLEHVTMTHTLHYIHVTKDYVILFTDKIASGLHGSVLYFIV